MIQRHHVPAIVVLVERSNLGCRTLVYHNFSKILTGVVGDLADWVAQTRVKSSQLLYTLLINEEDNVTQHLSKVLDALYRACSDDDALVVHHVSYCCFLTSLINVPMPPGKSWEVLEFLSENVRDP